MRQRSHILGWKCCRIPWITRQELRNYLSSFYTLLSSAKDLRMGVGALSAWCTSAVSYFNNSERCQCEKRKLCSWGLPFIRIVWSEPWTLEARRAGAKGDVPWGAVLERLRELEEWEQELWHSWSWNDTSKTLGNRGRKQSSLGIDWK